MIRSIQITSDLVVPTPANSPEPIKPAARAPLTRSELEDLFAIELGRVTLH